jgi:FlaA1/EpsC-like NDP-sugar epimerase
VLASLLFGVYSSVFIVFFLLLMHFATFWAAALRKNPHPARAIVALFLVSLITLALPYGFGTPNSGGVNWSTYFLWQDFFALNTTVSSMLIHLLHFFFFRLYIYETLLLNLYLVFALILALGLLSLYRLYVNFKNSSQRSTATSTLATLAGQGASTRVHTDRVRQINKFRRQTRRQNSSVLKHK